MIKQFFFCYFYHITSSLDLDMDLFRITFVLRLNHVVSRFSILVPNAKNHERNAIVVWNKASLCNSFFLYVSIWNLKEKAKQCRIFRLIQDVVITGYAQFQARLSNDGNRGRGACERETHQNNQSTEIHVCLNVTH